MLDAEQNAGAVAVEALMPKMSMTTSPATPLGGSDTAYAPLAPSECVPPAVTKPIRRARRAVRSLKPTQGLPDSAANPNNCGGVAVIWTSPSEPVPPAAVAPSADGVGCAPRDAHHHSAHTIGTTCTTLQELQIRRVFYIKRINMMDNAMKALVRRMLGWRWDMDEKERAKLNARAARIVSTLQDGKPLKEDDQSVGNVVRGDVLIVSAARMPMVVARDDIEFSMRKMVRSMPVWSEWASGISGFGPLGLAVIIGEAGDLSNYATVSRLWKRLGLAVINGERQRKKANAEDAIAHGYNPRRRAEVWSCVGDPLFKHQSARVDKETGLVLRDPGPYRIIYDRAKAAFLERGTTKKHAHDHGMRLATKELIKDLWVAWRQ